MPEAKFNPNEPDPKTFVKLREMDLASGWLGRFYGSQANAPTNIAGTIAISVVIGALIMTCYPGGTSAVETWKILSPIITMVLGFIFGRKV